MTTPPRPPGYARALRPDEQVLFDALTRVRQAAGGVHIEVGVISWPQTYPPQLDWLAVAQLPAGSSEADCYRTRRRVLMQRRFFALCKRCGQRHARGYMMDLHLCMGCAARYYHVIF